MKRVILTLAKRNVADLFPDLSILALLDAEVDPRTGLLKVIVGVPDESQSNIH